MKKEYRWKSKHADVTVTIPIIETDPHILTPNPIIEATIKTEDGQHFRFDCIGGLSEDYIDGYYVGIEGKSEKQSWKDVNTELILKCSAEEFYSNDWPELDNFIGVDGEVELIISNSQYLSFSECSGFNWKIKAGREWDYFNKYKEKAWNESDPPVEDQP